MLEKIQGIPARIASLKAKLKAREGKKEYKENCVAIRAEIARLEAATLAKAERMASQDQFKCVACGSTDEMICERGHGHPCLRGGSANPGDVPS